MSKTTTVPKTNDKPVSTSTTAEAPRVRVGDAMTPWTKVPKARLGDAMMPW